MHPPSGGPRSTVYTSRARPLLSLNSREHTRNEWTGSSEPRRRAQHAERQQNVAKPQTRGFRGAKVGPELHLSLPRKHERRRVQVGREPALGVVVVVVPAVHPVHLLEGFDEGRPGTDARSAAAAAPANLAPAAPRPERYRAIY